MNILPRAGARWASSPTDRPFSWVVIFLLAALTPGAVIADTEANGSESPSDALPEVEQATVFQDQVTVTATGSERIVSDTPGQVDVVRRETVETLGFQRPDDLVRYLPGVDLEGDPTRLGSNGFTIRGIGGNRVQTRIDGVPTAEQFDFGPFRVAQFTLDVDTLESFEVVRSAGSALYGSDALGGVVSLVTRDPGSYLGDAPQFLGLRLGFDGRNDELSEGLTFARGNERWQGSLVINHRDGSEADNQGSIATEDGSRTAPNPIDRRQLSVLGKLARVANGRSQLLLSLEWLDGSADTSVFSSQNASVFDFDAKDTQERQRLLAEQSWVGETALFESMLWRVFVQDADTEQQTFEVRSSALGVSDRVGFVGFEQRTLGGEVTLRKGLGSTGVLTYGAAWTQDHFDQFRDRSELAQATGQPVPTSLVFPTKYFPATTVDELGLYIQAELELFGGRLAVVPGLRYDDYQLDADQNDTVFLAGNPGTPTPADLEADEISPKLGLVLELGGPASVFAQVAQGFRAPPMSAVNNGFTNQAGGYRTLPNPDLRPETSDNLEVGFRWASKRLNFSATWFDNQYDDFIETVFLGFNPANFLVEFQPQNLTDVEIEGLELSAWARLGDSWLVRGAYTDTKGANREADEPLESIAPPSTVLGVRWQRPSSPWGLELTGTLTDAKSASDLPTGSDQFLVPSSEVFDLAAWWQLNDRLGLQVTLWNLTDETAFPWTFVRGQSQDSAVIDRYSAPGRSLSTNLRLSW